MEAGELGPPGHTIRRSAAGGGHAAAQGGQRQGLGLRLPAHLAPWPWPWGRLEPPIVLSLDPWEPGDGDWGTDTSSAVQRAGVEAGGSRARKKRTSQPANLERDRDRLFWFLSPQEGSWGDTPDTWV